MSAHDPYAPQDPAIVEARPVSSESADAATEPAGDPAVNDVPDVPKGTSAEVLSWVGEDKDKAQLALDAENKHKPRKGLVDELKEIIEK